MPGSTTGTFRRRRLPMIMRNVPVVRCRRPSPRSPGRQAPPRAVRGASRSADHALGGLRRPARSPVAAGGERARPTRAAGAARVGEAARRVRTAAGPELGEQGDAVGALVEDEAETAAGQVDQEIHPLIDLPRSTWFSSLRGQHLLELLALRLLHEPHDEEEGQQRHEGVQAVGEGQAEVRECLERHRDDEVRHRAVKQHR